MSFIEQQNKESGSGGLPPENFHNYIPYNAGECPFANIIRKLRSLIFDIEKTITGYQMINIQSYGWARVGKIIDLGALPHATSGFVAVGRSTPLHL